MNKTVYLRDDEGPIWERARELASDKLSPVIVAGLKRFLAEKEAEEVEAKGFERIVLSFQDADDNLIPKKKAFMGKWIISPHKPYEQRTEDGAEVDSYAVAITPKNAAAFYYWTDDGEHFFGKRFRVFASLHDAAADTGVQWAALKAIGQIGVPVEELDI